MPTYLSKEGLEKLEEELQIRKTVTRREIAERIAHAKELGDLSENFEYQEAKEDQGMNEVRIANLETMIKDSIIVKQTSGGDSVQLGATFVAEVNGQAKTFEIVGSNEADPLSGKISNESPLGKQLLGRSVGETIEVSVPSGVISYKITEIK